MKTVSNYREYLRIVDCIKDKYAPVFTNCYLQREHVERLIAQHRLSYVLSEGMLWIFEDNIEYKNIYYWWNTQFVPDIRLEESLYVVPRIYYAGMNDDEYTRLNSYLQELGFVKVNTLRQVVFTVVSVLDKLECVYDLSKRVLDERGMTLERSTNSNAREIREFLSNIEWLPVYQVPFISDEEFQMYGKKGEFYCVRNAEGSIIAVGGIPFDRPDGGFAAIADEYKMVAGIAPLLYLKIFNYCRKAGFKKTYGWIDIDNSASIAYHKSIGVTWGNRYLEYLIKRKQHG